MPPSQLGKLAGLAVKQMRIMPLVDRRPATSISSVEFGSDAFRLDVVMLAVASVWLSAANALALMLKTAKAAIRAAKPVPKTEIEAIIATILLMMPVVMRCRYHQFP